LGRIFGSTIWDSFSSKNYMGSALGVDWAILSSSSLATGVDVCRKDPLEAELRKEEVFLSRPI
jgi:hypothetical protein